MKIAVKEVPSCTWILEDTYFICTHDEGTTSELLAIDYTQDGNPNQYEVKAYFCSDPDCDEDLTEEVLNECD